MSIVSHQTSHVHSQAPPSEGMLHSEFCTEACKAFRFLLLDVQDDSPKLRWIGLHVDVAALGHDECIWTMAVF